MKILIINGPNINLTGKREKEHYGHVDYSQMLENINDLLEKLEIEGKFFQSNSEGEIVDAIQAADEGFDGIVINPAAYTHTSIAIRDALIACSLPAVEVHISNIYSREDFRKSSTIEDVVVGKICGFGWYSYYLGALALYDLMERE